MPCGRKPRLPSPETPRTRLAARGLARMETHNSGRGARRSPRREEPSTRQTLASVSPCEMRGTILPTVRPWEGSGDAAAGAPVRGEDAGRRSHQRTASQTGHALGHAAPSCHLPVVSPQPPAGPAEQPDVAPVEGPRLVWAADSSLWRQVTTAPRGTCVFNV